MDGEPVSNRALVVTPFSDTWITVVGVGPKVPFLSVVIAFILAAASSIAASFSASIP